MDTKSGSQVVKGIKKWVLMFYRVAKSDLKQGQIQSEIKPQGTQAWYMAVVIDTIQNTKWITKTSNWQYILYVTIVITNIYLSVKSFQPHSFNPSKCSTFLLYMMKRVETHDNILLNSTQTLAHILLQMIFFQPLWSSAVKEMSRLHTVQ